MLLLAFVISGFATSPAPVATAQAANNVRATFHTTWTYDSPDDTFTNGEVTGWKRWDASTVNPSDETGAPVTALALSLESTLVFDDLTEENLVTPGSPDYKWSFGDVPEGSGASVGVGSRSKTHPFSVTFSPGFDASRSVDKIKFSGPAIQTLTVTLTPREVTEGFDILVQAFEDSAANPVITSPTSGDGIQLSPDGHSLHISPMGLELNTTWSTTVTIQVVPKLPEIQYMPYVLIGCYETVTSRTTSGSFVTQPLGDPADGEGTWTWSAEGDYVWMWIAPASPDNAGMGFYPKASQTPNIPPILTSAGVSPASGTKTKSFAFEVTYQDADNDTPSYVRVYVDGSAQDMEFWRGANYLDALYRYATTLSTGQHTYYFEASDGSITTRFPEDGTLSIEVPLEGQAPTPTPTPAPAPTPTRGQAISWQAIVGIVAGAVITGLVIFIFIRRQKRV